MNKLIKTLKDNSGMTLVETLVAGTIIALIATIMVSGFLTAFSMMSKGEKTKIAGQKAYDSLVVGADSIQTRESGTLKYTFDNPNESGSVNYFEIQGSFVYGSANEGDISAGFVIFEPE